MKHFNKINFLTGVEVLTSENVHKSQRKVWKQKYKTKQKSRTRSNVWSLEAPSCNNSGNPPPCLCQRTLAQIRPGISSQVATPAAQERRPPAGNRLYFVFLLTVVKSLRRRLMQLAGYICPTTEEVACESQDPASPPEKKKKEKAIPPSLFQRLQTRGVQAVEGVMGAPSRAFCLWALLLLLLLVLTESCIFL